MINVSEQQTVPERYLSSWQEILNLAAGLLEVPSANIMRKAAKDIEILVSSASLDNPYRSSKHIPIEEGYLCTYVMETGCPLIERNVETSLRWTDTRRPTGDIIAYFGLPLYWPSGEIFGTICVLDKKERDFSGAHRMLLESFKDLIEKDFTLIAQNDALTNENAEHREIESALRHHAQALETRNAELDAYAHTVAHELKGPLSGILLQSEMLLEDSANLSKAELRRDLSAIVNASKRMSDIVDDLLLLAGLRQMNTRVSPLKMNQIVTDALTRLSSLVKEHDAMIELPSIWPVALGYGPWVEEVWVNFVSNAIKYGGRPPFIKIVASPGIDGMVHFSVRDNGKGVLPEKQHRLFAPFDRAGRTNGRGHGLGLSIARRITERLNGSVGVKSAEGEGATFSFTLPAAY